MEKQEKTPKYIAIDSDILRELTFLDLLKLEYGHVKIEQIPQTHSLHKHFRHFNHLYNYILRDSIRIVIVDAVYQESKHSENLVNFIKKYCYFPNINMANYQEKAEKARVLARAYCEEYKFEDQIRPAPMKAVFIADINKYVPSNDCYIMAQSTIEGLRLLTGNGQDFIFNVRNENKHDHDRVRGIAQINIINGYCTTNKKGFVITSAPMLLYDLVPILRENVNKFESPKQSQDLVKADKLL